METRTPEWITGLHELVLELDTELTEAGEVVGGTSWWTRAGPGRFTSRAVSRCRPTGRSPRSRSRWAGYWIVEVSEDRAVEIASQVVANTEYPMEVQRIMYRAAEL